MKNCKYLIACLVLLSVCMPSFGQEFIKRTPLEKSDSIIIRDVSGDSWLVYSHFFDLASTRRQAFVLFAEADATAEMMYLPDHVAHVNDFEIYDSIVYFAGDDRDGIGIMGYFDLATFPSSTVNICTVPLMASFHRLDVGVYDQTLHVFMTGDEVLGGGHIVDAWLNGTNVWQFDISINLDKVNRFDDVAALSSGVAVSGRNGVGNDGFIFFFPLPAIIPGPSIFSANIAHLYIPSLVADRILLDAGSGNNLAYVFHNTAGYDEVGASNWTTVNQYYTLATTSTPNTYLTSDISYGPTANSAELLMPHPGTFSQEIYTADYLSSIVPMSPIYYNGHFFDNERLYSLDAVSSIGGLFVAAGSGGYSENLSIYRYNRNSLPFCFDYSQLPYETPVHKVSEDKLSFAGYSFDIEAIGEMCQDAIIPVVTECDENNTDR